MLKKIRLNSFYLFVLMAAFAASLISCGDEKQKLEAPEKNPVNWKGVRSGTRVVAGDTIPIAFEVESWEEINGAISIKVGDTEIYKATESNSHSTYWVTPKNQLGEHLVKMIIPKKSGGNGVKNFLVTVLSPNQPQPVKYRVLKEYPHSNKHYTQGLEFHDGLLYEGTGQRGQSKLVKMDLEKGEVINEQVLPEQFFGEGITIFKDKIYQLTWESRTCFVYDLASFEIIKEFKYNTQGWGLTHNDEHLIMSDGSHQLYFLDPDSFEIQRTIQATTNRKLIRNLNELEYINGRIYANIYQTNQIAIIHPNNGEVEKVIQLGGLQNRFNSEPGVTDVLNGIAYNHETGRLLVTGKNWPKFFEIELIEKQIPS